MVSTILLEDITCLEVQGRKRKTRRQNKGCATERKQKIMHQLRSRTFLSSLARELKVEQITVPILREDYWPSYSDKVSCWYDTDVAALLLPCPLYADKGMHLFHSEGSVQNWLAAFKIII